MNAQVHETGRKLTFAGTTSIMACGIGIYCVFHPFTLPGFVEGLAWAWMVATGVYSYRLLYLGYRYGGVAWWAYVIGAIAAAIAAAFLLAAAFALFVLSPHREC